MVEIFTTFGIGCLMALFLALVVFVIKITMDKFID